MTDPLNILVVITVGCWLGVLIAGYFLYIDIKLSNEILAEQHKKILEELEKDIYSPFDRANY